MPRRVQDIIPGEKRALRESRSHRAEPEDKLLSTKRTSAKAPTIKIRRSVADLSNVEPLPKKSPPPEVIKDEEPEEISINRVSTPVLRMPITPPLPPRRPRQNGKLKWLAVTLVVLAGIALAGYFASAHYARATFTIVPKVVPATVNGTYIARSATATSSQGLGLSYEVLTLKAVASTTVAASSGPQTSTKSAGKVTLYNAWSAQPIRLIAGTRLSSGNDLIYKLTSSVVIPGYTKPKDVIIPGALSASIVADKPGQEYNLAKSSENSLFKIVAYKGSPKYDNVNAKALTDIAGGFLGTKIVISPSALASSTAGLKTAETALLFNQAKSSISNDQMIFHSGYVSQAGLPQISESKNGKATVSSEITLYVFVFKKNDLIQALAGSRSTDIFGAFGFKSPGLETIQFGIANLKDFSLAKKSSLIINAKGNLKLIGLVPVAEIKKKLAGRSLAQTQEVFKSFSPVIESGTGELAPPWAKVPTDLSRIIINVKEE